jgi:ATP phosphoribosyltransferase-like protein
MAVKVMVEKTKVVETMDRLEAVGATAIIETEVKNCRL